MHEAFVEAAVLDAPPLPLDVAVAPMDLRRLREARELLVGRLGGDNPGRFRSKAGEAHGVAPLVERVELHEAGPGLVEHDVVAETPDALENAVGVVDRAVVGALLDHGDAERPLALPGVLVLHQRIGSYPFADRFLVEILGADGADEAVGVAVGGQIDRYSAGHQQGALVGRLVVVAVEQDEVALGDEIGQHDLVGGRGAVQHEIGFFRAEYRRGLLLRLQSRAFVGQEVAELEDRVVEVVAEDRFAQMLHEDAADRAATVEDAAVVAGAGPELVALLGIVDERAEERRLQRLGVLLEARHEVFGDEFRRLLCQEDVAVDEVEHLDGDVLEALAPDQDDDRHIETTPAHQIDQRRGLALDALLAPVDDHAADRRVGLHGDLRVLDPSGLDHLKAHPLDRRDDLIDPEALEIVGVEHRRGKEEGEALRKVHWIVAPGRLMARGARALLGGCALAESRRLSKKANSTKGAGFRLLPSSR